MVHTLIIPPFEIYIREQFLYIHIGILGDIRMIMTINSLIIEEHLDEFPSFSPETRINYKVTSLFRTVLNIVHQ